MVESQPSKLLVAGSSPVSRSEQVFLRAVCHTEYRACVAQLVEHFLGKEEVTGSIPVASSEAKKRINWSVAEFTLMRNFWAIGEEVIPTLSGGKLRAKGETEKIVTEIDS